MGVNAFTMMGKTATFTAAGTAPTPVQVTSPAVGAMQYRIINAGNVVAFLGFGPDAATATTNAVAVTTSQNSLPLLPGTDEILSFLPNAYFTGVTTSGTAVIYITPGDGL